MKNYHNIEKSEFRKGEYIGYCEGRVYRIAKLGGGYWRAINQADNADQIYAFGLEAMSQKLQEKVAV
jgi:hypothetical protein